MQPSSKNRVLFVIHGPNDIQTAIYMGYSARSKFFQSQGWEAEILTPQSFPFLKYAGSFLPFIYPLCAAFKILTQTSSYDLVLFHSYAGWVIHLMKKLGVKIPFKTITAFHGVEAIFFKALEEELQHEGKQLSLRFRIFNCGLLNRLIRFSCRVSDAVFCLNRYEKQFLIAEGYQDALKIFLLFNETSDLFFMDRTYAPKARRLLFVGQWLMMKGIRYLREAFEILADENPDLDLTLVGTLKSEAEVRKDFPSRLQPRIHVFPRATREEMAAHFKDADIFIMPTLSEAFNRSLGEAMASGLPAVTTPTGFAPDLIRNNENAILIPVRNSSALAAAVQKLISDRVQRQNMGTQARESIKPFRSEQVFLKWFEACRAVLNPEACPTP